ncbi:hypothetical protein [Defluviimonas aestuarii]|uniref:DUF7742 family protein n=1 Tax=Albidovulum aestuarii TaxID=1130726 RepID=UPI00249C48C2|nr:hypothetical protein [Defluviimonas aestuarii]
MRQVIHGDVVAVARAVVDLPPACRVSEIRRVLECAHAADLYRKHTGRSHPSWGNGSLAGAVMGKAAKVTEPFLSDLRYLEAMAAVIETLLDWKHRKT